MRRKLVLILALLIMVSVCIIPVSANGVPPMPFYSIALSNLPEGTVYVDLLVKLPQDDSAYTPLVEENLPESFAEDAEIIGYCEKDYRSYTFHYKSARSIIVPDKKGQVYFFTSDLIGYGEDTQRYDHKLDIERQGKIRLAMLDEMGNILQVSRVLTLSPNSLFAYILGEFQYDAKKDILDAEGAGDALGALLYVVIGIFGTLLTCLVERVVAWPFGIGKDYSGTIWLTNLISQVLMRIVYVPLYGLVFRHYWYAVFFLELLIYVGEYIVYSLRMKDVSRIKILMYTIAANTASLMFSVIIL